MKCSWDARAGQSVDHRGLWPEGVVEVASPLGKQIGAVHCWRIFSGPSLCMLPVWCSRPPLCILWQRIRVDSHWALIAWWSLLAAMETTTLKLLLFLNSAALERTGCQAVASVIPPRLFGFVYISHVFCFFLWCRIILWCFYGRVVYFGRRHFWRVGFDFRGGQSWVSSRIFCWLNQSLTDKSLRFWTGESANFSVLAHQ